MQENHSYDNYFGTYPRGDGIPKGTCIPNNPLKGKKPCVKPFPLLHRAVVDLKHDRPTYRLQYDNGKMDGFVSAYYREEDTSNVLPMGYYTGKDLLPFYWNVADQYVLFDRYFTSAAAGSVENHMYWVTGVPGNKYDVVPRQGWGNLPTIFDRLQAAGVSWKFYVQNYNPHITFRNGARGDRGAQVVWVPLLDYARFIDDPKLSSHIVDMSQYYKDLESGNLPSVSYLVPSGASEHPPGSIEAGERFVKTLIVGLMESSYWKSSAFMWSYDDWGGWFDHVRPPQVDSFGYGFRAPALLVSAYARKGYIDHTTLDFTSDLKFIEQNWNVEPLATRDRNAKTFMNAFDFNRPPRSPVIIPYVRGVKEPPQPRRVVIDVAYSFTLIFPSLLLLFAAVRTRDARGRRSRVKKGDL
jgi:phospholipase C